MECKMVSKINDVLENQMKLRNSLQNRKNQLKRELLQVEREIKANDDAILNSCQHNWVRDTAYYGPYEKPDNICTICHSIHYRF